MVNPSDEIYKKKFVASILIALIYCYLLAQAFPYPISFIPMFFLIALSFGYMLGKKQIGAYPLGMFLMSSVFTFLMWVGKSLGVYNEILFVLAGIVIAFFGAGVALPAEEDWGYIHGWEKTKE